MSLTPIGEPRRKTTISTIQEKKGRHEPITCLTAYDYSSARLVDEAGIDIVLVGDSLAQVMLGYENTLPVTVDEMLHHTRAVRRAVKQVMGSCRPFFSWMVDMVVLRRGSPMGVRLMDSPVHFPLPRVNEARLGRDGIAPVTAFDAALLIVAA